MYGEPSRFPQDRLPQDQRQERLKICAELLERVWGGSADASVPTLQPPVESADTDDLPAYLGHFEVCGELGRGGFGVVLLAVDTRIGRQVALKVPHAIGITSKEFLARFEREAQAGGRLDHPYIAAVYEAGQIGPVIYLASAYCPGTDLGRLLQRQSAPLPPRQAAALLCKLCQGLHHAHQRGVLHRDLKPSNILLVESDDCDLAVPLGSAKYIPKISDFGLARIREAPSDVTRQGSPLGTLAYMAPEQAEGRWQDTGVFTDVYALGVILYQLITGQLPFVGENDLQTLQQICSLAPTPPSRLVPSVPKDLEAICLKCLSKDGSQRYATAADLSADLSAYLAGLPIAARPVTARQQLLLAMRRSPAITALLLSTGLSLIALLAGQTIYSHHLAMALNSSEGHRKNAEQTAALLDLQQAENLAVATRAEATALRARKLLYASDLREATDHWRNANIMAAREWLRKQMPLEGQSDIRGYCWHFLHACCQPRPTYSLSHGSSVRDVVTFGEKELLTSASDGWIRKWQLDDGQLVASWPVAEHPVQSISLSPTGQYLVAGGDEVQILDLNSGQVRKLGALESGIETVSWSPCGRWIAAGARYSEFAVWTPAGELKLQIENDHRHETLLFSPDGQQLLVATRTSVDVWDLVSGTKVKQLFPVAIENVRTLCWLADGQQLALGDRTNFEIEIFDYPTGQHLKSLTLAEPYPQQLAARGDGLLVAGEHGAISFLASGLPGDATTAPSVSFIAHEGTCRSVLALPDGRVVTAGDDGLARLWEAALFQAWPRTVAWPRTPWGGTWFDPQQNRILSISPNSFAEVASTNLESLFNPETPPPPPRRSTPAAFQVTQESVSTAMSSDRRWIAACSDLGDIGVWDLHTLKLACSLRVESAVQSIAITGSGRWLAAVDRQGRLHRWQAPQADWAAAVPVAAPVVAERSFVAAFGMPHSEDFLLCETYPLADDEQSRRRLLLWPADAGTEFREIVTLPFWQALAVNAEQSLVAAGCTDSRIRIASITTGEIIFTSDDLKHGPTRLLFTPENNSLISGHTDGSIWSWHIEAQRCNGCLYHPVQDGPVTSLDISPHDQRLLATLVGPSPALLISMPIGR